MIDTTKTIREVRYNGTAIPLLGGVDNPIVVTSDAEMETCLNDDKYLGMYVKFSGESENYLNGQVYKIAQEGEVSKFYQLPTLDNEGTAADLAAGKQLINSQGIIVTGTKSDIPVAAIGDFWVKVIDYDGTVLLEKRGNNGDSFDLPSAPSHEGLVFQEWSASCPITDGKVVIDNNNIMAGAVYTTASGQNEFDITLTKITGLAVTLNMNGTKDWGDGTSDTNTAHTYTAYGDYTIKCNGTTMTTTSDRGLFGQSDSIQNYYCTAARFATITKIDQGAFYNCYSLTNIIISNSIIEISTDAFHSCLLTSIIIPNSVTYVSYYAFSGCRSLVSVVIPNGITSIIRDAFSHCVLLTNIVIPNSVTGISYNAFGYCTLLTDVIIPNGVTSIGDSAFSYCYSLTSIVIPNSVTTIGNNAFLGCCSLTNIVIPDSVTNIPYNMFRGSSLTNIIIPDSVVSIGGSAFFSCCLTSIIIPNGVTSIGDETFEYCYSLTDIVVSGSITSIGDSAFSGCRSLTKYDFSQCTAVPTLSKTNAFTNINKIAKIIVPDSLYDEWIVATNWSTYADYIYKASEVNNE